MPRVHASAADTNQSPRTVTEIYAVPSTPAWRDGKLFVHVVGSAPSTDVALGRGTDPWVAAATVFGGQAQDAVGWYSSQPDRLGVGVAGPNGDLAVTRVPGDVSGRRVSSVPLTSLHLGGMDYVQMGDSVVALSGGSLTASYPLPILRPDPIAGKLPDGYTGLDVGPQVGNVSALVPSASGDVLAFSFTGRAAAVTDLMTGDTNYLSGYSCVGSAVRTESGDLLVTAWEAQAGRRTVDVLRLAAESHDILATMDTGLPSRNALHDTLLAGPGPDAVLAISGGDSAATLNIELWRVGGASLTRLPRLPTGSGLAIAPAASDSVYVYGGPARNTVGLLDLESGAFTPNVARMRTAAGSYVVAILR